MGRSLRIVPLVAVVAFALVACADSGASSSPASGSPSTAPSASAFPVTVDAANGTVTIPAAPTRIVSLSPTATEMLFAIGAGNQVVAVDDQSNYPAGAPTTKLSGYEPNAQALAVHDPDFAVY